MYFICFAENVNFLSPATNLEPIKPPNIRDIKRITPTEKLICLDL